MYRFRVWSSRPGVGKRVPILISEFFRIQYRYQIPRWPKKSLRCKSRKYPSENLLILENIRPFLTIYPRFLTSNEPASQKLFSRPGKNGFDSSKKKKYSNYFQLVTFSIPTKNLGCGLVSQCQHAVNISFYSAYNFGYEKMSLIKQSKPGQRKSRNSNFASHVYAWKLI